MTFRLRLATQPDHSGAFMKREQDRYAAILGTANIEVDR